MVHNEQYFGGWLLTQDLALEVAFVDADDERDADVVG